MDALFRDVARGVPLDGNVEPWRHARNRAGESLLHVAAKHGRLYAVWILLKTHPCLAADADHSLQLPEHVAFNRLARQMCERARKRVYPFYCVL